MSSHRCRKQLYMGGGGGGGRDLTLNSAKMASLVTIRQRTKQLLGLAARAGCMMELVAQVGHIPIPGNVSDFL